MGLPHSQRQFLSYRKQTIISTFAAVVLVPHALFANSPFIPSAVDSSTAPPGVAAVMPNEAPLSQFLNDVAVGAQVLSSELQRMIAGAFAAVSRSAPATAHHAQAAAADVSQLPAATTTAHSSPTNATTTHHVNTVSQLLAATAQPVGNQNTFIEKTEPPNDLSIASKTLITQEELTEQLDALRSSLLNRFSTPLQPVSQQVAAGGSVVSYTPIVAPAVNNITNVTVTGGISGLTASDIPDLSASYFKATSTISIAYGGTGTSTYPSYGKLLLGNKHGGYDLVATSSLGIISGASYTFAYPLKNTANAISLAFGTTTNNTWAGFQTFTNAPIFSALTGGGLAADAAGHLYTFSTSTWRFASSTLLADSNAFRGVNAFQKLSATYASTTQIGATGNSYLATAGGNVGIGTVVPGTKLEVHVNSAVGPTAATFVNDHTGAGTSVLIGQDSSTHNGFFGYYVGSTFNNLISNTAYFGANSGAAQISVNAQGTQPITFNTDNWVERMRIQAGTGNVGIGTTTPGSLLSLGDTGANTINISNTATSTFGHGINIKSGCFAVNGVCIGGGSAGSVFAWTHATNFGLGVNSTSTPIWFKSGLQASSTSQLAAANFSGNVGIGTTNPSGFGFLASFNKLALDGSSITGLTIRGSGNPNYFSFLDLASNEATSKDWALVHTNSGQMTINSLAFAYNNGSATTFPVVINSSGNVGIGTTTPGSLLSLGNTGANTANISMTATSTFGHGINIKGGCFAINGVCVGKDTVTTLSAVHTYTSNTTWTKPTGLDHAVVELYGGGGGGGAGGTSSAGGGGGVGGDTNFGGMATSTGGGGGGGGGESGTYGSATGGTGGSNTTSKATGYGHGGGGGGGGASGTSPGAGGPGGNSGTSYGGSGGAPNGSGGNGSAGSSGNGGGPGGTGGSATGGSVAGQYSLYGSGGTGGTGNTSNKGGGGGGGGAGGHAIVTFAASSLAATEAVTIGTGGAAGTGGNGGSSAGSTGAVIVYEFTTHASGADLAELYPVNDQSISAGDIVTIDGNAPITMGRAVAGSGKPLAGIVSTNPGVVLKDKDSGALDRPIALAGRVPTKVNLEGGPIKIGDRIAISSVPGVGKKATSLEDSVGIALEPYDGTGTSTIKVLIDLERGTDVNAIGSALLATSTATSSPSFVDQLVSVLTGKLFNPIAPVATTTAAIAEGATGFIGNLFSTITKWFADAGNGIHDFFAENIHASNEICVGQTCVTESQLKELLASRGTNGGQPAAANASQGGAPIIEIQGANPARIALNTSYVDLGARITGPTQADTNLGLSYYVDGTHMQSISLNTASSSTHIISYVATNSSGTATTTRTVIVEAQTTNPQTTNDMQATSTQPAVTTMATTTAPSKNQPQATSTIPVTAAATSTASSTAAR